MFVDSLGDQLGVDLGAVVLQRLDLDVTVAQVFQVFRELIDLLALFADDHADAGRVDENRDLLTGTLDADLGNPRAAVAPLDEFPDLEVFDQEFGEILLVGVPCAGPVHHDPGAEARRSNFLTHDSALFSPPAPGIRTYAPVSAPADSSS